VTLLLVSIIPRQKDLKSDAMSRTFDDYVGRISRYTPCETNCFDTGEAFMGWLDRQSGRTPVYVTLLDNRGQQFSSEEFAGRIGRLRDEGTQRIVLAIGPADGWSDMARQRANLLLSLGRMTLPHQLARVVLAEQVYRAMTILAGHPYHCGH
jgi:23S rRNA (pseudouridine1915-N3)-methyltransferase